MIKYCFILGNNPLLSLAEIFHYAEKGGTKMTIIDFVGTALIVECEAPIKLDDWQTNLGGSIKIGTIETRHSTINDLIKSLSADNLVQNYFTQHQQKIIFGFSCYGTLSSRNHRQIYNQGLRIKKELKQNGYKSRLLLGEYGALTSVQITKNDVLARGADILIVESENNVFLGKTHTVQAFEKYSHQDYGRPQRDARSGMIPPKLAKIMINCAKTKSKDVLLDPFCGSGTIIQQAQVLGIQNIIGSDISKKAIEDTKQNISWQKQQYPQSTDNITLFTLDVKNLQKEIQSNTVDCIVTEPYLGPPLQKEPTDKEAQKNIETLEALYTDSFKSFSHVLKNGAIIVIVFPLFKTKHGTYVLKILETIQQFGFSRINPIPDQASVFSHVNPTARGSLIYKRPDQKVHREIFIFRYHR